MVVMKYSVDKFKVRHNIFKNKFNYIQQQLADEPSVKSYQKFGFSEYRHNMTIQDYNGDGEKCSFACFYMHNADSMQTTGGRADFVIEFNPNKCTGSKLLEKILKMVFVGENIRNTDVLWSDIAIDLHGVSMANVYVKKNGKSIYKDFHYGGSPDNRTLYIGDGTGRVKIYNKKREMKKESYVLPKREYRKILNDNRKLIGDMWDKRNSPTQVMRDKIRADIRHFVSLAKKAQQSLQMLNQSQEELEQVDINPHTRYEVSLEVKKKIYELHNPDSIVVSELPEIFTLNNLPTDLGLNDTDQALLFAVLHGYPIDSLSRKKKEKLSSIVSEYSEVKISTYVIKKTLVEYVQKFRAMLIEFGGVEFIPIWDRTDEMTDEQLIEQMTKIQEYAEWKREVYGQEKEEIDSSLSPQEIKQNIQENLSNYIEKQKEQKLKERQALLEKLKKLDDFLGEAL